MKAFGELKIRIEEKGFKLLQEAPSNVYKDEISCIVEGNTIHIYVHFPIIEREPLTIYEYLNVPFFASNDGGLVTLESESSFLAIDETTHNGVELTAEELSGCKKVPHQDGNIYLCGSANLVKTNVLYTCLGTIFSRSHSSIDITTRCKMFITKEESYGKELSWNSFLLFNKSPKKLTHKCGNSQRHEMVEGLTKVETNPGCQVFTENFIFFSKTDVSMES